MTEKQLHEKTISELKNGSYIISGIEKEEFVNLSDLKDWAIAIVKKLDEIPKPCREPLRGFLIKKFELKESDLK
jgi:hypothetical protein